MSLNACAEILRRGDPDRFLAAMAAPASARQVLFALYAFNVEVARAPWVTAEPLIAEMRLQWWRDALDEIAAGGIVRRHEVTVELAHVLDPEGARLLDALIVARRADIEGPAFDGEPALLAYVDATAGNLMWCAARALGAPGRETVVRAVARAAGLARYLVAVPALTAAGRRPLPTGCDIPALCARALGDWPDRALTRSLPAPARAALLEAWRARAILRRAMAHPQAVQDGGLEGSEFARRAGLLKAQTLGL